MKKIGDAPLLLPLLVPQPDRVHPGVRDGGLARALAPDAGQGHLGRPLPVGLAVHPPDGKVAVLKLVAVGTSVKDLGGAEVAVGAGAGVAYIGIGTSIAVITMHIDSMWPGALVLAEAPLKRTCSRNHVQSL